MRADHSTRHFHDSGPASFHEASRTCVTAEVRGQGGSRSPLHVDESTFVAVVTDAALDARVTVTLVEKRTQARDHPVLVGVPETHYLKCLVLRKLG